MKELLVGVGDGQVSCDPDAVLVTYALGSCVAVMIHDPVAQVAGMVHYMLPRAAESNDNACPWKFADTGIARLLQLAAKLGADPRRLNVFAAGGAHVMNDSAAFNIAERNCLALREVLRKFRLVLDAEDVGGTLVRTVRIEVGSGRVRLQSPDGEQWEL